METYGPEHKATVPRGSDPKWRYFWKLKWPSQGEPAAPSTDSVDQVVPEGFPTFEYTMEKWGNSMLQAVASVANLLALGYGLPPDTFKEMLLDGRHLLAPTGALLSSCCAVHTTVCVSVSVELAGSGEF